MITVVISCELYFFNESLSSNQLSPLQINCLLLQYSGFQVILKVPILEASKARWCSKHVLLTSLLVFWKIWISSLSGNVSSGQRPNHLQDFAGTCFFLKRKIIEDPSPVFWPHLGNASKADKFASTGPRCWLSHELKMSVSQNVLATLVSRNGHPAKKSKTHNGC